MSILAQGGKDGPLSHGFYSQVIAQKASETSRSNDVVKEMAAEKLGIDAGELITHIHVYNNIAADGSKSLASASVLKRQCI